MEDLISSFEANFVWLWLNLSIAVAIYKGSTTFSIMTLSIETLSIIALIDFTVTLTIKDTHHNETQHKH